MIKYITIKRYTNQYGESSVTEDTNILNSPMQCLVNATNCVGVMGKGVALQFRRRYERTNYFAVYRSKCATKQLRAGMIQCWTSETGNRTIINAMTKGHWSDDSTLADIEEILQRIVKYVGDRAAIGRPITGIALPRLGCGLGKLSWDQVGPLYANYLEQLDIPITVYIEKGDIEYTNVIIINPLLASITLTTPA